MLFNSVGIKARVWVSKLDRCSAHSVSLLGLGVLGFKVDSEDMPILLNPSGVMSLLTKDAFDVLGLSALLTCC